MHCTRARAAMARAKWSVVPEAEERGEERTGRQERRRRREKKGRRTRNELRSADCGGEASKDLEREGKTATTCTPWPSSSPLSAPSSLSCSPRGRP